MFGSLSLIFRGEFGFQKPLTFLLAKALVRSYISSHKKWSIHGAQIPCNETIIATKILLQQISNQSIIAIRFITLSDRFPKAEGLIVKGK